MYLYLYTRVLFTIEQFYFYFSQIISNFHELDFSGNVNGNGMKDDLPFWEKSNGNDDRVTTVSNGCKF